MAIAMVRCVGGLTHIPADAICSVEVEAGGKIDACQSPAVFELPDAYALDGGPLLLCSQHLHRLIGDAIAASVHVREQERASEGGGSHGGGGG